MMTRPYLLSTTSSKSSIGGLMMPSTAGVPATLCPSRAWSAARGPIGQLERHPGYQPLTAGGGDHLVAFLTPPDRSRAAGERPPPALCDWLLCDAACALSEHCRLGH